MLPPGYYRPNSQTQISRKHREKNKQLNNRIIKTESIQHLFVHDKLKGAAVVLKLPHILILISAVFFTCFVTFSVFIPISGLIEKFSKFIAVNGIQMEFNNKVLFY